MSTTAAMGWTEPQDPNHASTQLSILITTQTWTQISRVWPRWPTRQEPQQVIGPIHCIGIPHSKTSRVSIINLRTPQSMEKFAVWWKKMSTFLNLSCRRCSWDHKYEDSRNATEKLLITSESMTVYGRNGYCAFLFNLFIIYFLVYFKVRFPFSV